METLAEQEGDTIKENPAMKLKVKFNAIKERTSSKIRYKYVLEYNDEADSEIATGTSDTGQNDQLSDNDTSEEEASAETDGTIKQRLSNENEKTSSENETTIPVVKYENEEKIFSASDAGHLKGLSKYSCAVCGKFCTNSSKLKDHERIHTNEKPHVCSYCSHSFRLKASLVRHVRIHTGNETPKGLPLNMLQSVHKVTYMKSISPYKFIVK